MTSPIEPPSYRDQFVILDDGSTLHQRYEGDTPPPLPGPGRVVTEAEYLAARDALRGTTQEALAASDAAVYETLRGDYEALRSAGIPVATAQRLTGFTAQTGSEPGA